MESVYAFVIGIIEGFTEFLPVSSTAHILLSQHIFGAVFNETFIIGIQMGALLAVIMLYLREYKTIFREIPLLLWSFFPTAVVGLIVYPYIYLIQDNTLLIASMLILGGAIMIALPNGNKDLSQTTTPETQISFRQGFLIGIAQVCAIIPGVSRSGAVFVASRLMNLPTTVVTRFSFLLGAGTIFSATTLSIVKSNQSLLSIIDMPFIIAFVSAGITAWLSCRWLLSIIVHPKALQYFGWYRIVLGCIILIFLIF